MSWEARAVAGPVSVLHAPLKLLGVRLQVSTGCAAEVLQKPTMQWTNISDHWLNIDGYICVREQRMLTWLICHFCIFFSKESNWLMQYISFRDFNILILFTWDHNLLQRASDATSVHYRDTSTIIQTQPLMSCELSVLRMHPFFVYVILAMSGSIYRVPIYQPILSVALCDIM